MLTSGRHARGSIQSGTLFPWAISRSATGRSASSRRPRNPARSTSAPCSISSFTRSTRFITTASVNSFPLCRFTSAPRSRSSLHGVDAAAADGVAQQRDFLEVVRRDRWH